MSPSKCMTFCGSGVVDPGEACDDGPNGSHVCDSDCTTASCGDGLRNILTEDCDPGGASTTCNADCSSSICGDGVVNPITEQCDGGDGSVHKTLSELSFSTIGSLQAAGIGQTITLEAPTTIGSVAMFLSATNGNCDGLTVRLVKVVGGTVSTDPNDVLATGTTLAIGPGDEGWLVSTFAPAIAVPAGMSAVTVVPPAGGTGCAWYGRGDVYGGGSAIDLSNLSQRTFDHPIRLYSGAGPAAPTDDCRADCTEVVCGDSVTEGAEECDTLGESATCDVDCTNPSCGDGTANAAAGEACDTAGDSATCDADCTAPSCGDGRANAAAGEACDTAGDSATCDADCTPAECGDGVVNAAAGEACDDGDDADADGCSATCVVELGYGCTGAPSACEKTCGNGTLDPGELCDQGADSAICDADCTPAECGDGVVNANAGEACDDGAETATCDSDCTAPACGDVTTHEAAGESCDDGDTADGDGCDAACSYEARAVEISEIFVGHSGAGAFVELHSTVAFTVDLSGFTLGATPDCVGTHSLEAGQRRVVALDSDGPGDALVCEGASLPEGALELLTGGVTVDLVDLAELSCHFAKAELAGFTRSIERTDDGFCLSDPGALFGSTADSAGSPGAAGACAERACDGDDDDCNGTVDDGLSDQDEDGTCDEQDCRPAEAACSDECDMDTNEDDVPDCADPDDDGDGLADTDEAELGTSPVKADSDGDGVPDGQEVTCGSDPTDAEGASGDGDGDGQCDDLDEDTDDDGVADALELLCGNDPELASDVPTPEDLGDDDGDGVLNCVSTPTTTVTAGGDSGCRSAPRGAPSELGFGAILLLGLGLLGVCRRRA